MSRTQLSGEELAKLTSQIVGAFCEKNPFEASELPGVIAAVAQALQELNSAAPVHRAALVPDRSRASVLRGLKAPLRGVQVGEIRSTIQPEPVSGTGAALSKGRPIMRNFQTLAIDPAAVRAVSSAYNDAMSDIEKGSGYLPSTSCRRRIAGRMIAAAADGEGNARRLKEVGLAALRDGNVVPLWLTISARLRQGHHDADLSSLPCEV
jgi:hypothetical protein